MTQLTQVTVTDLVVYPVKALQGIHLQQAIIHAEGLAFDREWVVVDQKGRFVSQRQFPPMAAIKTALTDTALQLSHPSQDTLSVAFDLPQTDEITVSIWNDTCIGYDQGPSASEWLTKVLGPFRGGALRLVRFAKQTPRLFQRDKVNAYDPRLMFADKCPYLIVNEHSLAALNQWLADDEYQSVTMDRFRGNIQVNGAEAWQEYQWQRVSGPQWQLVGYAPCERCQVPGVDQSTGVIAEKGQPYQTLQKHAGDLGRGAYFGQHLVLAQGEGQTISIGDVLQIEC